MFGIMQRFSDGQWVTQRNLYMQFQGGLIQIGTWSGLALQIRQQCSREKLKRLVSFAIMLFQLLFLQEVVNCVISIQFPLTQKEGKYLTGKLVERTMMCKHGVENVNEHFKSYNNICDATEVISFPLCLMVLLFH